MGASRRPLKTEFFHHLYFTAISNKKQWNEHGFYQSAYRKGGLFARLRLSNNPFGEAWRTRRPATSIVAAAAGRVRRSFRLTPSGRFATFGGNSPLG